MNKKIVIVGGGSAGWITALYAEKAYKDYQVILVESEDIGILGAGEGTTADIVPLFDFLEIPLSGLIKNCNATIKNAIKLTNWNKNSTNFYHSFFSFGNDSDHMNFSFNKFLEKDYNFSQVYAAKFNHNTSDYSFSEKISEKNLVPFIYNFNIPGLDPIFDFTQVSNWAVHFDARLLAKYLRSLGESRGIIRKEGIVNEIILNDDGYIDTIKTNKEEITCDFVFDCTGFRRLIIGNLYKSRWISYSKYLPTRKALPFFLTPEEDISPYSEAIAMDYGWAWKIPLQNRVGCGYVFDNQYIDVDSAKIEIENMLGKEVDPVGLFEYEPGCYEEVWIKNCLAVGLSANFLEPLEATALLQTSMQLKMFMSMKSNIKEKNKTTIDRFNKKYCNISEEMRDFVYLHYMTNKDNTDFWKNFTKNNTMPDFIQYVLEIIKTRPINSDFDFTGRTEFGANQYLCILSGKGIIDRETLTSYENNFQEDKQKEYKSILDSQENNISKYIKHKDFISYMIKKQN